MSEDDATKQKKMTEEAKKKKDTQKPEEKKNVADVKTQTPFSADSVRITWESGDEMHLFVSRLCEEGFKKVAPPWMKVHCKANDYGGSIMFSTNIGLTSSRWSCLCISRFIFTWRTI